MPEDRDRHVLARIVSNPELARAVPLLRPEVLHAAIAHYGLPESGELLALATPEQLSAVFDLDLWKAPQAGGDEQFDVARFCEWLELLVDAGPEHAAVRLAEMDVALVVAGLSPNIAVFDSAVFAPVVEPNGADPVLNDGRERGVHAEIGSYVVVARRTDVWDAIVDALVALEENDAQKFHHVMRACCRLSSSGRELDGLDDLLSERAQARFDLAVSREQRRDRLGFLSPDQARAFLDAARHISLTQEWPPQSAIFVAYQRASTPAGDRETGPLATGADSGARDIPIVTVPAVASVIEALQGAGVLADTPRVLLPGAQDEQAAAHPMLRDYLRQCAQRGDDGWSTRSRELVFLANALIAGCSIQGRTFSRREATDAVAATCNLGLEQWPDRWPASNEGDLVVVFQVGWASLHSDVLMAAAAQLVRAVEEVRTSDRDLQLGLHALVRELHRQRRSNTPWRARDRLEVLAPLDLPAWAALTALFDECPVMLANVGGRAVHTVNPSEFQFIADRDDLAAVERFLLSLPELLTRVA